MDLRLCFSWPYFVTSSSMNTMYNNRTWKSTTVKEVYGVDNPVIPTGYSGYLFTQNLAPGLQYLAPTGEVVIACENLPKYPVILVVKDKPARKQDLHFQEEMRRS